MRASTKKLLLCALASTLIGCTAGPGERPEQGESSAGQPQPTRDSHGEPGAGDPYYPNDGNGGYDALAYDVSITYDPEREHLTGDSELTAKATQDLSRFNLDLRKLEVEQVRVDGQQAQFRTGGDFELVITPAQRIDKGSKFTTEVKYKGKPTKKDSGDVGALGWHTTDSGAAYALGEPHSAAFWYPVNETPRDKARFKLAARVPKGWKAVSGGEEGEHDTADGWTTYRWEETNPVASYLTTIAVDKFTIDRSKLSDGTPVVSAYAPGAEDKREVEANLDEVVEYLSGKFGPYPQTAAGGIYMSENLSFALETQGRPTYAAWAELTVVVHEYAHQWFGNSVTLKSWSDLCLNECFASYVEWMWDEDKQDADLDGRYLGHVRSTPEDSEFWSNKLHEMGKGKEFDGVYDKGALAMHALRNKIGDKAFFRVLKDWAAEHEHGNASWPQFERFVMAKTGKDLEDFFDSWFRGDKRPPDKHLYPGDLRR